MTDLRILPLTPDRLPDYLGFMAGDAFADNPRWASCFCHCFFAARPGKRWEEWTAEENRAAAGGLIESRRPQGHLAYRGGRVVGWCNATPRPLVPALRDEPCAEPAQVGAILCFVVAKPQRGAGVARGLLALFRAAGFAPHAEDADSVTIRRRLRATRA